MPDKSARSATPSLEPGDTKKSLIEYLTADLKGSSLQIKEITDSRIVIEAEKLVEVKIELDESKKNVTYEISSPEWKRPITVEELDGFDFLESRAEADLKKLDLESNAEDVLLSIDLVRYWATANGYTLKEEKQI